MALLPRISILGGSSPFTAALIEELADPAQGVPASEIVLHGRNQQALDLLTAFARHRLGPTWRVRKTTDLQDAIAGAMIVIHQIRYGGLEGRAEDERLAASFSAPPDETLGPAGLQAALRTAPALVQLGEQLRRHAPQAWVLNLTNPLSVATACLAENVGQNCLGLCELPLQTMQLTCDILNLPSDNTNWSYAGLNHRGFVYQLERGEDDLIARLNSLPQGSTIGGIPLDVICKLKAVPTKYYCLMLGESVFVAGRAAVLESLRSQIVSELAAHVDQVPRSLGQRNMPWYGMSVVPVIASILNDDGGVHVANVLSDGIVREQPVAIRRETWQSFPQSPPNASVRQWIDRFEQHERAVMAAVREPSNQRILEAIELDPVTPRGQAKQIASQLTTVASTNNRHG